MKVRHNPTRPITKLTKEGTSFMFKQIGTIMEYREFSHYNDKSQAKYDGPASY